MDVTFVASQNWPFCSNKEIQIANAIGLHFWQDKLLELPDFALQTPWRYQAGARFRGANSVETEILHHSQLVSWPAVGSNPRRYLAQPGNEAKVG